MRRKLQNKQQTNPRQRCVVICHPGCAVRLQKKKRRCDRKAATTSICKRVSRTNVRLCFHLCCEINKPAKETCGLPPATAFPAIFVVKILENVLRPQLSHIATPTRYGRADLHQVSSRHHLDFLQERKLTPYLRFSHHFQHRTVSSHNTVTMRVPINSAGAQEEAPCTSASYACTDSLLKGALKNPKFQPLAPLQC